MWEGKVRGAFLLTAFPTRPSGARGRGAVLPALAAAHRARAPLPRTRWRAHAIDAAQPTMNIPHRSTKKAWCARLACEHATSGSPPRTERHSAPPRAPASPRLTRRPPHAGCTQHSASLGTDGAADPRWAWSSPGGSSAAAKRVRSHPTGRHAKSRAVEVQQCAYYSRERALQTAADSRGALCGSRHFLRPDHTARAVALQELKTVVWRFSKDPSPSLGEHPTQSKLSLKVPWGGGKAPDAIPLK